MNLIEAEARYNKAKSDLACSVETMKIFGKEIGLNIDEIEDDVITVAELE